jgi:hypothetical protein
LKRFNMAKGNETCDQGANPYGMAQTAGGRQTGRAFHRGGIEVAVGSKPAMPLIEQKISA